MNSTLRSYALLALLVAAAPANAHQILAGQLIITHPWVEQTAGGNIAYGCMKITNTGKTDERLIAATIATAAGVGLIPASGAKAAVPFELTGNIVIPAGQTIRLRAGSPSVMSVKLTSTLVAGSTVPGNLTFENTVVTIEYEVGD